jgi:hypothetical protein
MRIMTAENPVETPDRIAAILGRGWTPDKRVRFLDLLAQHGNARAAASEVGLSVQTAYRLRRRDALFARGWNAALLLARDSSEQLLAELATEGIEEEIWYRGQRTGTKVRFDTRLLLAHLGRLDRLADEAAAAHDAGRFDQLLACVAGEQAPPEILPEDDPVPDNRGAVTEAAAECALNEPMSEWGKTDDAADFGEEAEGWTSEQADAFVADRQASAANARTVAGALWDEWAARAVARVDSMIVDEYWCTLPGLPGSPLPDADAAAAENPSGHSNPRNPGDNEPPPVTPVPEASRTH